MKRNQFGFTLIETSIAMGVIGLLVGMVLKEQELISSAKVKDLCMDFKSIPLLIYAYQGKFKALPGDDVAAVRHVAATVAGNGNGIINGSWSSTTTTDESYLFWQHVRLAGLAPGSTTVGAADYLPSNAVGDAIGIQSGTNCSAVGVPSTACTAANLTLIKDAHGNAIRGTYIICSSGILGKYVKQLDIIMDDGNTDSGAMMATPTDGHVIGTGATATAAIDDATKYDVCMGV